MPGIPAAALSDDVLVRYEHPQLLSKKEVSAIDRSSRARSVARSASLRGLCLSVCSSGGAAGPVRAASFRSPLLATRSGRKVARGLGSRCRLPALPLSPARGDHTVDCGPGG